MRTPRPAQQRGVALAVVVWFIAGMSLLVAGIVSRVTVDTRLAQAHLFRAQAEAAGDGAVSLLLADLFEGRFADGAAVPGASYTLGEHSVQVVALPTRHLLDLNSAPAPQLRQLFERYGGAGSEEARALASAVVKFRGDRSRMNRGAARFAVIEDLLRVNGMTRTRFDAVRHMITAGANGSDRPRLEWIAAHEPAALLAAGLPRGAREAAPDGGRGMAGSYRVDALVAIGDEHWLRRRWVDASGSADSALPWSTRRVEPARAVRVAP
jgi:hypothetical protein